MYVNEIVWRYPAYVRRSVTHGGGKGPMVFVGHYFDGLYYY